MKKSSVIYIVSAVSIIVGGVYFAVVFGLKPKPIPKISWSHFVSPEDYGANIYKRLRLEVQSQNLLFLGVIPERQSHYLAWKGFLNSLEPEHKFAHIIVASELPFKNLIPFSEEVAISREPAPVVDTIKDIIASRKKVAIIVPSVYMSYLVKENLYALLVRSIYDIQQGVKFDVDWMTFSLAGFPQNRDDEKKLDIPCDTDVKDQDGSGALGCMIVLKARTLYRKNHVEGKIPAVLDQIGTKEYLGLIN
ncbi:MAG: hypothetical protein JNL11_04595 [Bdellovibrionaceae bacterium]|nr:hypothetical protein [Pseudobdellovibrionaceae bacterium]